MAETADKLITVAVTKETRQNARILAAYKEAPLSEAIADAIRDALKKVQAQEGGER